MLVCVINAFSPQWCSCIFTLCYTHLKSALLLHKTATAKYILHRTVAALLLKSFQNFGRSNLKSGFDSRPHLWQISVNITATVVWYNFLLETAAEVKLGYAGNRSIAFLLQNTCSVSDNNFVSHKTYSTSYFYKEETDRSGKNF